MRPILKSLSPLSRAVLALCSLSLLTPLTAVAQEVSTQRPTVDVKPRALDWRKVPWPTLDFTRQPTKNGGALYTVPDNSVGKFAFTIVLPGGVYSLPREKRPALGAYVDLLLQGGTKSQTFEEIEQFTSQNGLSLSTSLTDGGEVRLDASGLSSDFDLALKIVSNILLEPSFRDSALETWKRERISEFEGLLDAKSLGDQYRLMTRSRDILVRGEGQYFTTYLDRIKPSMVKAIKRSDLTELHKTLATGQHVLALLSGRFNGKNKARLAKLLESLPKGDPASAIVKWLPERSSVPAGEKIRVTVINKPDMRQTSVSGVVLFDGLGKPNMQEDVSLSLAGEVFSSSAGVVGEDRFSGALRRRSGLSYSAGARSETDASWPNTNEASWRFSFQTPTEKSEEGLKLAWETWRDFVEKGISKDEFEATRIVMMNKVMATEITNSSLASVVLSSLLKGEVPPATPFDSYLATLEGVTSAEPINALLKRVSDPRQSRAGFVLMGALSEDEIEDIEDLDFVDSVEVVPYEKLKSELLQ